MPRVEITIPYDSALSKNVMNLLHHKYLIYANPATVAAKKALSLEIRSLLNEKGLEFKAGKVWVSIYVLKPDSQADAINFLDTICDSVKEAIEVDDKYFAIGTLDWAIAEPDEKPTMRVVVSQSRQDVEKEEKEMSTQDEIREDIILKMAGFLAGAFPWERDVETYRQRAKELLMFITLDGKPALAILDPDQSLPKNPYTGDKWSYAHDLFKEGQEAILKAGFRKVILPEEEKE